MRFVKVTVAFLLFLLLFIAAWQNIPSVLDKDITFRLDLYWARWESTPIPVYLIAPICFFAGLALMGVLDIGAVLKLRRRIRKLEKQLESCASADAAVSSYRSSETSLSGPKDRWQAPVPDESQDTAS